jgi:transcription elongation GreA/GreB family factor
LSRAFAKEDDGREEPDERPLPSGPNYVTPRGFGLLREKVLTLEAALAGKPPAEQKDLRYWRARLASAVLVDNAAKPPPDIRFGAHIQARDASGRAFAFEIVGQDEADEARGRIAWDSALAYAFNGRRAGDEVSWSDGETERVLTIVSFRYA